MTVGVTRWGRIRNEDLRRRAEIEETLTKNVDIRVVRWFGHVERMVEWHWPRKVKAVKVKGQKGKCWPTFGWLDGVKSA